MTGILFMAGSIARTIGPIIVSFLFDHYGPEATWGMQILVMGVTILIWVIFYRKIAPFDESGSNSQLDKQGSMKSSKTDTISINRL
jgi:MFS family permease